MAVYSSPAASFVFFYLPNSSPCCSSNIKLPRAKITPFCCADLRVNPGSPKRSNGEQPAPDSSCSSISCSCTRRRFTEAAAATALFPICPSNASDFHSDYTVQVQLSLSLSQHNLVICFQNVMLSNLIYASISLVKDNACDLGFKGNNLYV